MPTQTCGHRKRDRACDDYLQQLFRGGASSIALHDFIFQTLSIINFISPTIRLLLKMFMFEVFQRGHY